MTTPNGTRIEAVNGRKRTDITAGVQALYDLVINSMDWGSGFLTVDDALPVVDVARTCGFAEWERAQEYVDSQRDSDAQRAFIVARREAGDMAPFTYPPPPHDHVWSPARRNCMWSDCRANERDSST